MESSILDMAITAAGIVLDPSRLMFVVFGVLIGLALGVIPGLSGIVGLSLLLPFTFDMEPYTALAFLIGLQAVVGTSDTIPAVLFGVPGTVGSAATILDGHPMAKQGRAARAFGAAFSASVIGGLFGALFLALSVPILRPLILNFGSPELLAFCVFGLSLVGVLSGRLPLKGLAAAALGLMISTTGEEPNTAIERWTFGTLYLLDGLPLVPAALGLFALPEIADMVVARRQLVSSTAESHRADQWLGIKDTLSNIFLVIRSSAIGSVLGAIPGIGAAVIDWIAYGHALRTEKGASETFGKGDVRGVIASEASNNAKEGGALVTTIAFGVPATASMALVLGAFLIHGLTPGPDMLSTRLDVTYTLAWTLVVANVIGAGLCFLFAKQLAGIARIRAGVLAPVVLSVIFIGAFQGARQWGDLIALLVFGLLGWAMKRVAWPRPPLLLGLVLGTLIERYLFISFQRYGSDWLSRPVVIVVFLLALYGILQPIVRSLIKRKQQTTRRLFRFRPDNLNAEFAFGVALFALFAVCVVVSWPWDLGAKLIPQVVGWAGMGLLAWQSAMHLFAGSEATLAAAAAGRAGDSYDNTADFGHLSLPEIRTRALRYFAWCLGLLGAAWVIGLLPAVLVFLIAYLRFESREPWRSTLLVAGGAWALWYLIFHRLLAIPWPPTLLGDWLPALRASQWVNFF